MQEHDDHWPYDPQDTGLASWIGHVHYDSGEVKEVSVVTGSGASKIEALSKVCRAIGIGGPNEVGVKGVVLALDKSGAAKIVYGAGLRRTVASEAPAAESVELPFQKYRVSAYPTALAAYVVMHDMQARSGEEALTAVLKLYKVDSISKSGNFLVQRYMQDGSFHTVMSKGKMPGKGIAVVAPETPAPKVTEKEMMIRNFRALLATENTKFMIPLTRVQKESS
jgi:hypothetical protein